MILDWVWLVTNEDEKVLQNKRLVVGVKVRYIETINLKQGLVFITILNMRVYFFIRFLWWSLQEKPKFLKSPSSATHIFLYWPT